MSNVNSIIDPADDTILKQDPSVRAQRITELSQYSRPPGNDDIWLTTDIPIQGRRRFRGPGDLSVALFEVRDCIPLDDLHRDLTDDPNPI